MPAKSRNAVYEIEAILDQRASGDGNGPTEYLIHWKGYPLSASTWEAETNLQSGHFTTVDDEEEYEVEAILDKRQKSNDEAWEYLVHWKGYPASESTWEPERNLGSDFVQAFEKKRIAGELNRKRQRIFSEGLEPVRRMHVQEEAVGDNIQTSSTISKRQTSSLPRKRQKLDTCAQDMSTPADRNPNAHSSLFRLPLEIRWPILSYVAASLGPPHTHIRYIENSQTQTCPRGSFELQRVSPSRHELRLWHRGGDSPYLPIQCWAVEKWFERASREWYAASIAPRHHPTQQRRMASLDLKETMDFYSLSLDRAIVEVRALGLLDLDGKYRPTPSVMLVCRQLTIELSSILPCLNNEQTVSFGNDVDLKEWLGIQSRFNKPLHREERQRITGLYINWKTSKSALKSLCGLKAIYIPEKGLKNNKAEELARYYRNSVPKKVQVAVVPF